jgi:hypothetical protein
VAPIGLIYDQAIGSPATKEATTLAAYQISERKDSQALAQFLQKEGQLLLPMVGLIEQARLAVDELIDVTDRAALEAVLHLFAEGVAGWGHCWLASSVRTSGIST